MLAGLVKSPTIYNPIKHEENAYKRKNLVLQAMLNNKYISNEEYEIASKIKVSDMLYKKESNEPTYPYQAYIDVVYSDLDKYFNLTPYSSPLKVYTYLNKEVQLTIDNIQKNIDKDIKFNDELLNIGGVIINNENGAFTNIIGGRNYNGERLYNHALNLKAQPASTIKPLLSYALAFEHLHYASEHTLFDKETYYPNTNIKINNVDNNYLGEISIEEALGYSRNTTAVSLLNEVINHIGKYRVTSYLKNINMLDIEEDEFTYSYALGGYKYGVNPINLAASYSMIANYGIYHEPCTIKYIELCDTNEKIYPNLKNERMLSEEGAFLINNTLRNIINKTFYK